MQKRLRFIWEINKTVNSGECAGDPKTFAYKPLVCVPGRSLNFCGLRVFGNTRWSVRSPKIFQAAFGSVRKQDVESFTIGKSCQEADNAVVFGRFKVGFDLVLKS